MTTADCRTEGAGATGDRTEAAGHRAEDVRAEAAEVPRTVLLLGGTGRTGSRVLRQLLDRGVYVRAVVRSTARLPEGAAGDPKLTVVEADLLSMGDEPLARLVDGCDAAVSCLGHTISAKGVFGRPRDLVTAAARRLYRAAGEVEPARPLRFVLMSSVSVLGPGGQDAHRGAVDRAALWALRGLVPPTRDNQDAADFLREVAGADGRFLEWTAVRPDTLREGDVCDYEIHEGLVSGLFRPRRTRMANVAHFMCELVTDDPTWERWRGELPVILDRAAAR